MSQGHVDKSVRRIMNQNVMTARFSFLYFIVCFSYHPTLTKLFQCACFSDQLWNAVSEGSLGVYRGHSGWVHCVAFSQDTCKLVSASDDETVKV